METKEAKNALKLWAVVFWLLVWQSAGMLLSAAYPNGHLLLATPTDAVRRLLALALTGAFWRTVCFSVLRIFGGFLCSCTLALLAAALSAKSRRFFELLQPLITVIKTVPVASFIILALVWLNSRDLPLFISALMTFPPIYLNVLSAIRQTDPKLLEMAKVFRVPAGARLRGIYLPQVLPYFRSASSAAIGLCWKAGVAAEIIALSVGSIGEQLYNAKVYYETPDLFAWTVTIVLISVLLEALFSRLIDALIRKVVEA